MNVHHISNAAHAQLCKNKDDSTDTPALTATAGKFTKVPAALGTIAQGSEGTTAVSHSHGT